MICFGLLLYFCQVEQPKAPTSTYCQIAQPVRPSRKDTAETIQQAAREYAKWKKVCAK